MAASIQTTREVRKRRNKSIVSAPTPLKVSKQLPDLVVKEEEEAAMRDSESDVELFTTTLKNIKILMKEILDLKLQSDEGSKKAITEKKIQVSMLYLVLKKLNRLDKFRCQKAADSIQEAMHSVDNIHLQLQNLHYEAVHLKKEITKCLEFKSLDEDVHLVTVERFYEDAPEGICQPDQTKKDIHHLMLARLQWELQQRKELAKKLSSSQNKQKKVLLESAQKLGYLENLRPTLKSILKAAKPLRDELGVPLLASETFHEMAKHLPQPLCMLFVQSSAYMDACDKNLKVTVEGDDHEAISWKATEDEIDEDSDSDQEETGKRKRRRQSKFNKMESRRKKLLQKHPLHVEITIYCSGGHHLVLKFFYLMSLHIVTVETVVLSSVLISSKSGNVLSSASLLNCLFPFDSGDNTPNPSNHYQLKKLSMNQFSNYIIELGRPYLWAQRVCGLMFVDASEDSFSTSAFGNAVTSTSHSVSSSNMEDTMRAIKSRFQTRINLQKRLISLEKGTIPLSTACAPLFCPKIVSRIFYWKNINPHDLSADPAVVYLFENNIVSKMDTIFSASFERSSAKLTALIFVAPDYPKTAPYFVLNVNWQGVHSSFNDTNVRDMEQEVNIHWEELLKNCSRDEILVNQLERLRMCFDIYLETATMQATGLSEGPCEFQKEKIFVQAARGKDHGLPFKFIPKIGIFTHR